MEKERVFKFNFDSRKGNLIYRAIEEREIFVEQVENSVSVAEDSGKERFKRTKKSIWAYDAIYASLNRIEDTLLYINSLELGKEQKHRSAFDFFDFLNNMYVVIHCIKTLGKIFEVPKEEFIRIEKATDCFEQKGMESTGSDDDFFEYVRSLASVHPVDTGMHPAYHGYGKVHCSPFVVWTKEQYWREGDLSVHVYTSEKNGEIVLLDLWVNSFERYLQKWIDFIDVIVIAINKFTEQTVNEYISKQIKTMESFDSYYKYIANLGEELAIREGEYNVHILENYARLFQLKLSDDKNAAKFELYKNAIRYSLQFLHNKLQEMNNDEVTNTGITYPDRNVCTELYIELWKPRCRNSVISQHGYELEKMYYLDGSGSCNEQYSRRLLEGIKPIINKYVFFSNEEPAFETQVLVSMALYFECLGKQNVVNRNIPNSLEYREKLIPESEWEVLITNEQPQRNRESRLRKFMKEYGLSPNQ